MTWSTSAARTASSPAHFALNHTLAASADAPAPDTYTNFLTPARQRLRIDVEHLREVNPAIIYAKATGQGPRGPEAALGGYDISAGWARPSMAYQMMAFGAGEPPAMPPGLVDLQEVRNVDRCC